jgi:L-alanine-DL-glutamate epimerase-like enolase superfamily enzyme
MTSPLIHSIETRRVSFRMLRPFVTAQGRKTQTDNLQITVNLSNRMRGLAEASSSIAMPNETPAAMESVINDLTVVLRGRKISDVRDMILECWNLKQFHPTAVAGLECALLDAASKTEGRALYLLAGGRETSVESDFTLPVGRPADLQRWARKSKIHGFRKLKIKLAGDSPDKDAERIVAAAKGAPKSILVADGNQGLTLAGALRMLQLLERCGVRLKFLEQPFPKHDLPSMRIFRKRSSVPLVADESVRTAVDAVRLFETEAVDGVNVKIAKSGFLEALEIIHAAKRFNKLVSIGCMEESKLGLAASVHLACGAGGLDWIDLDSVFLLGGDRIRGGFSIRGAKLSINPKKPGIGV